MDQANEFGRRLNQSKESVAKLNEVKNGDEQGGIELCRRRKHIAHGRVGYEPPPG